MSDEAALLAAVAAAPDDDLPRLVYADWLDEHGRPLRAEFIRLQIEIAKKETLPRAAVNAFAHLWKRQQQILDDHRDELLGPLAGVEDVRVEFRRGFIDDIMLKMDDFTRQAAALAALTPRPERVRIIGVGGDVESFSRLPASRLELVTDLSMAGSNPPSLAERGEHPFVKLILNDRLPRLRMLDLESCHLGDFHTFMVFMPAEWRELIDLDLSFNDLTDAGVIDLLESGVPQRLKRLVLGGNPIGDDGAIALADALGDSLVLESLNLRMTEIGQRGQAALLRRLGGKVDLF